MPTTAPVAPSPADGSAPSGAPLDPAVEAELLGPDGPAMLALLRALRLGEQPGPEQDARLARLERMGACVRQDGRAVLTRAGRRLGDAAREHGFWLDRGRRLHDECPGTVLDPETFRGRDVLEVGSGMGSNLFRIAPVAARVVGVDVEPVCIGLSRVVARLEGLPDPDVRCGRAEALPFEDGSFDWVVLFGALQYMDIDASLREFRRVLRPGGRLLTVQGTLARCVAGAWRDALCRRSPRALTAAAAVVVDTLWVQAFGRRLRPDVAGEPTARPVYPTRAGLARRARLAGLRHRPDLGHDTGRDHAFVFEAP